MNDDLPQGQFLRYVDRDFNKPQMERVRVINRILAEYKHPLTARQLYYQHVARGLIPNDDGQYKRLVNLLGEARLAGLVAWDAIEDRGRNLVGFRTYAGPVEAVKHAHRNFKTDMWASQPIRLEAWVEKQALEGVVGRICDELRVNFFATKGYNSLSEMWRAGRRFQTYYQRGQRPVVLHLADHDPAGLDMTRDTREKLSMFAGVDVTVIRVGLNMDQVRLYNPPPQPAKEGDKKTPAYVAEYGEDCWELDALPPGDLQALIAKEVAKWRDEKKWEEALLEEVEMKKEMQNIVEDLGGEVDEEEVQE